MRNIRWERAEALAEDPYRRPSSILGRLEVWCQETPHSFLISMLVTILVTIVLALWQMAAPPTTVAQPSLEVETLIFGDSFAALEQIAAEMDQQGEPGDTGTVGGGPESLDPDLQLKEVQDQFGELPDPNATVAVDKSRAKRLRENTKNLADGIQIQGLPSLKDVTVDGVPISGVFDELVKNSKSMVFVIDKSGSMYGNPLRRVVAELEYAIGKLNEDQKFFVIFFDHTAWPMYQTSGRSGLTSNNSIQLQAGTPENTRKVTTWMKQMRGNGGTQPGGAMLMALSAKPEKIVLLSDGEFSQQYVGEIQRRNAGGETSIDCIGLNETVRTLQEIAAQNNGKYYQAK